MSEQVVLEPSVVEVLRARLPDVAEQTVVSITHEVREYDRALEGDMGRTISTAVQTALAGFLRLAASPQGTDPATPVRSALEGAYALGRGEARSGRTADALLAAYRVGARVAWRELSAVAVSCGLTSGDTARFAELVFAYIDQLSAASVAGHADESATTGRVREQYRERLGRALLDGAGEAVLLSAAERADWVVPRTLTAVLVPGAHVRAAVGALPRGTLVLTPDVLALDEGDWAALLVPDADRSRPALLSSLRGRVAVVGPTGAWQAVRTSYARAVRAVGLAGAGVLDTEQHLTALVLGADPQALADLRAQVLAPLADVKAETAERLAETLRAWLLHQGRREDVAAHLHVHPQTVRYRMGQLRELYGDALADPEQVLALVVALGPDGPR